MVERIQDLNLPINNISKIIKDSLPNGVNLDKGIKRCLYFYRIASNCNHFNPEARIAIARATSVFIMYLSSNAAAMAHKHNHKTFNAQDVLDSISEMDFKSFTTPMKNSLITFQKSIKDKKDHKKTNIEARKSIVTYPQPAMQEGPSGNTLLSPVNAMNTKKSTPNTPTKLGITISSDIIEIDDSD